MSLADRLRPCGPVFDPAAAARVREVLAGSKAVDAAWPALEPMFAASPYLSGLARADPKRLERMLASEPNSRRAAILAATRTVAPDARAAGRLRQLKAELHLLTALADLGGVWDLDQVTGALTAFLGAIVVAVVGWILSLVIGAARVPTRAL